MVVVLLSASLRGERVFAGDGEGAQGGFFIRWIQGPPFSSQESDVRRKKIYVSTIIVSAVQ